MNYNVFWLGAITPEPYFQFGEQNAHLTEKLTFFHLSAEKRTLKDPPLFGQTINIHAGTEDSSQESSFNKQTPNTLKDGH